MMTPLLPVQELPDMPSALLGVARGRLGDMGQGNEADDRRGQCTGLLVCGYL